MNQATISPEQHLWLAVIERAFEDALATVIVREPKETTKRKKVKTDSKDTVRNIARSEAARWFADGSDDFKTVCELAGLDPAWVQRLANKKLKLKGLVRL